MNQHPLANQNPAFTSTLGCSPFLSLFSLIPFLLSFFLSFSFSVSRLLLSSSQILCTLFFHRSLSLSIYFLSLSFLCSLSLPVCLWLRHRAPHSLNTPLFLSLYLCIHLPLSIPIYNSQVFIFPPLSLFPLSFTTTCSISFYLHLFLLFFSQALSSSLHLSLSSLHLGISLTFPIPLSTSHLYLSLALIPLTLRLSLSLHFLSAFSSSVFPSFSFISPVLFYPLTHLSLSLSHVLPSRSLPHSLFSISNFPIHLSLSSRQTSSL